MSDALAALLEGFAADRRPWLRFLERRWSRAAAHAEAVALAAGLADAGLRPGEPLGLLLPNLPAAAIALLAAWHGGFVAAPVDPRRPPAELARWQARALPVVLATLDLATVYERARPLFERPPLRFVLLARIGDQLSWPKRWLSPWLRAGGVVTAAADPRLRPWPALLGAAQPAADLAGEAPALLLPDGERLTRDALVALARPGEAGCRLLALPLADPAALAALLSAGELVLSPRLDARSLAKVAKAARPGATVA